MVEQVMPGELHALHSSVAARTYMLLEAECTLGRNPTCTVIVQRLEVSRLHARIVRDGLRYILHDAGSANGTFVNGRPIDAPHPLAANDQIGLGDVLSLLHFIDPNATVRTGAGLRYDGRLLTFTLNGKLLELSVPQRQLLLLLYREAGKVCTHESCAQALWGRPFKPDADSAALHQAVNVLRGKLRAIVGDRELIRARRGVGYTLDLRALGGA